MIQVNILHVKSLMTDVSVLVTFNSHEINTEIKKNNETITDRQTNWSKHEGSDSRHTLCIDRYGNNGNV